MNRPSLASAIEALRTVDARFDWVHPTDAEADVAAVLEVTEADHQGNADEPDQRGRWGRCTACRQPWPCPAWIAVEDLAVQFLGRGVDRYWADAQAALEGLTGKRPA